MCLSFQPLQADSLSCSFQEQLLSSSHLPKYLHLEQIILLVDMFLHQLPFPLCTWLTSRKRLEKPHPPRSLSYLYTSQVHRWVKGVIYSCLGKTDGENSSGTKMGIFTSEGHLIFFFQWNWDKISPSITELAKSPKAKTEGENQTQHDQIFLLGG